MVGWWAFSHHAALHQHTHPIGKMLRLVEIMGRQEHRGAVSDQGLDEVPRLTPR
jgi:hypothetical protein